jgi:hypothetical protein
LPLPAASSSAAAEAAIRIVWPPSVPSPSDAQEAAAALLMLPRSRGEWARASTPARFADEPPLRQAQIARDCRALGIDLGQAASLRNTLLRSKCPWRFEGGEALREAAATRLEDAVGAFLAAHGVRFRTQAQQQEDARRAGLPPAKTPDFLLLPGEAPLLVNGRPVRWIEVKRFYGAGSVAGLKKWPPVVRAPEQVRLGCGAQALLAHSRACKRPRDLTGGAPTTPDRSGCKLLPRFWRRRRGGVHARPRGGNAAPRAARRAAARRGAFPERR